MPAPVKPWLEMASVWGLPGALSWSVRVPFRRPTVLALKTRTVVKLAPGLIVPIFKVVPLAKLKSSPVIVADVITKGRIPVFVITRCLNEELGLPTAWGTKVRGLGENSTFWALNGPAQNMHNRTRERGKRCV